MVIRWPFTAIWPWVTSWRACLGERARHPVDDGLEPALELGLDLEREDVVDVRIGAKKPGPLHVADELGLLRFDALLCRAV